MDENVAQDRPYVVRYRPYVLGDGEIICLPRLGHHVRDVENWTRETRQGLSHPAAEEGGDRARKKAPRSEHEHVGTFYGLDDPRWSGNPGRLHVDLRDLFSDPVDH